VVTRETPVSPDAGPSSRTGARRWRSTWCGAAFPVSLHECGGKPTGVFLALEVGESIRARMQETAGPILRRSDAAFAPCPRPEDLHLTLVFLGDTRASELSRLAELMDGVAQFQAPFRWAASGVDTFGPPGRPKVVWAGIRPCPPLLRLQQLLADGVARLGHPLEARAFVPHLTLARVDAIGNDRSLTSLLASITNTTIGEQLVSRVLLMRSGSEPNKSRYYITACLTAERIPPCPLKHPRRKSSKKSPARSCPPP
jgi:2'-5' RNA ligase